MQLVTVGSRYQIVIPKEVRKKVKGLRPGSKVGVKTDEKVITLEPAVENWVDKNYGKYKKYLKGAAEEVEKMRNEWEEKSKELEPGYGLKKP